jgi:hypothetical protein
VYWKIQVTIVATTYQRWDGVSPRRSPYRTSHGTSAT